MTNILIGIIIGIAFDRALMHFLPVITQKIENSIKKVKGRTGGKIDVSQLIEPENSQPIKKKRKFLGIFNRRNKHKSKK